MLGIVLTLVCKSVTVKVMSTEAMPNATSLLKTVKLYGCLNRQQSDVAAID